MIETRIGDIFESKAQTLVNTVNCVGVMGKGIALQFKERFPDMFDDYVQRCTAHQVRLGEPYLFKRLLPPWILNFPTKDHWRSVSRLDDIVRGLDYLKRHYREWGITSLAVPPLGCGEGRLEWRVVGPTLYRLLSEIGIPVELYAPYGTPGEEIAPAFLGRRTADTAGDADRYDEVSAMNPAWVALVQVVDRIEKEPYHWPVGRTTFQKIAYFATECGISTGLHYAKGSYGPFAADVKGVLTRLVNNGLIREEPLGRMLAVKPGPTFRDAVDMFREKLSAWEPVVDRITDLFLRMRTQQAEVAATVHFAARWLEREGADRPSERDVLNAVKQWKQKRRPPFQDEEVACTIRNLGALRWLDVRPSADLPLPKDGPVGA